MGKKIGKKSKKVIIDMNKSMNLFNILYIFTSFDLDFFLFQYG